MQKNNDCQKKVFCFYNGKPAFYSSYNSCHKIIDLVPKSPQYDEILEAVKNEISNNTTTRPHLKDVYSVLGSIIAGKNCTYYNNKSVRETKSEDSFETVFTEDIKTFLDLLYKRGPSQYEKDAKAAHKNWLNSRYDYYAVRNKGKQIAFAISRRKKYE